MSECEYSDNYDTVYEFYRAKPIFSVSLSRSPDEMLYLNSIPIASMIMYPSQVLLFSDDCGGSRNVFVIARNNAHTRDMQIILNVVSVLQNCYKCTEYAIGDATNITMNYERNYLMLALRYFLRSGVLLRIEGGFNSSAGITKRNLKYLEKQMALRGVHGLQVDSCGRLDLRFLSLVLKPTVYICNLLVPYEDEYHESVAEVVLQIGEPELDTCIDAPNRHLPFTQVALFACIFKAQLKAMIPYNQYTAQQMSTERCYYQFGDFDFDFQPETDGFLSINLPER